MDDLYQKSRELSTRIDSCLRFARGDLENINYYLDKARELLRELDACQLELMQKQTEFNQQLVLDNIKFGAKI